MNGRQFSHAYFPSFPLANPCAVCAEQRDRAAMCYHVAKAHDGA